MVMIKAQLNNILGTPFTLRAGDQSAEVEPSEIVPLLSVTTKGNKPQVVVDAKAAALLLTDKLPTLQPNRGAVHAGTKRARPRRRQGCGGLLRQDRRHRLHQGDRAGSARRQVADNQVQRRPGTQGCCSGGRQRAGRHVHHGTPGRQPRVQNIHRIADLTQGCTSLRVGRSRSTTSWGNAPRKRGSSLHR